MISLADHKSPGQLAYEAELADWPYYHTGEPRPSWDKLFDLARWSWERDPTPRSNPDGFAKTSSHEEG